MLEFDYMTDPDESAKAALDYLRNRPMIGALFNAMKFFCIIYAFAFTVTALNKSLRVQDYVMALLVVGWFFFYAKFSLWLIKRAILARNCANVKCSYKIDDKSILCNLENLAPQHIEWRQLRYILRNNAGYIIPLTGISNAGKFMWIPNRSIPCDDRWGNFLRTRGLKIKYLST